jgi:hypothetical protein
MLMALLQILRFTTDGTGSSPASRCRIARIRRHPATTRRYHGKIHTPTAATGAVAKRRNQEIARALWKLFVLR